MDVSEQEHEATSNFKKFLTGIQEQWQHLTTEQKCYFLAIALPIAILAYDKAPDFLPKEPQSEEAAFAFFFVFSAAGVFQYLSKLAEQINSNILLKACFSAFFVAGVTLALSFTDGMINETLKVSSAPFSYTQTIAALLLIPVFIAFIIVGLSIISIFLIIFSPSVYYLQLVKNKDTIKFRVLTIIARYGVIIFFGSMSQEALTQTDGYQRFLAESIQSYAYNFEMEVYSHCEGTTGERFAYIDSTTVVVATKKNDSYNFTVRACRESIPQGIGRTIDEKTKRILTNFIKNIQ